MSEDTSMRYLRRHWRPLFFLAWCVVVQVAYFRQFVPYWEQMRELLGRLAGGG